MRVGINFGCGESGSEILGRGVEVRLYEINVNLYKSIIL